MPALESGIQRSIVTELRKRGAFVVKLQLIGFTGLPDLVVFLPRGRLLLMEVKRLGGKLSPRQVHVFGILERLGHVVHVVFSKSEAIEVYENV